MKKMYIEKQGSCTRVAIKREEELEEILIQEAESGPHVGEIYKGIVKNIINANNSAFIDIGIEKNCYMQLGDSNPKNLKNGDHVIVEIVKEAFGDKGPKVTADISIQGNYCVLVTFNNRINFSKNIDDVELKKYIIKHIEKPKDMGVIIRSKALEATVEEMNVEIEYLYNKYVQVIKTGTYTLKPKLLYSNRGIINRILREYIDESFTEIITNSSEYYHKIVEYMKTREGLNIDVNLYDNEENLFSYYGIEKKLIHLRSKKISLPSGGNIVIDKTEAMYVVDVNTAQNTKHESMRNTFLSTNLEAAEEIVKQIKLRNLAGIIIIDFIDMYSEEDKEAVKNIVEKGFSDDKNKTKIYPFTPLGLLQITRKRVGKDIYSYLEENCQECSGEGKRLRLSYIEFLIKNIIYKIEEQCHGDAVYIEINEQYKKSISEDIISFIKEIDALDKNVYLKYTNNSEVFKVEPILFMSQIKKLQSCKIYENNLG